MEVEHAVVFVLIIVTLCKNFNFFKNFIPPINGSKHERKKTENVYKRQLNYAVLR